MNFKSFLLFIMMSTALIYTPISGLFAQNTIKLTLDMAVDIAMKKSYKVRTLEMKVKSSNLRLQSEKASLNTQVYMNLKSPDMQNISENKWNSTLNQDEIIRQYTRLWQSELSIKQPLMLGNYPTNGSLSLNYKLYQYEQFGEEDKTDLYNRFYLKFQQPFFVPNEMKNNLEAAELDLKENELKFISDQMDIMQDIAEDYYDLFKLMYEQSIYKKQIQYLENVYQIADAVHNTDSTFNMDFNQVQLELNNAKEELMSKQSSYRQKLVSMKQLLRLNFEDSLIVIADIKLKPLDVNLEQAIAFGLKHNQDLQRIINDKKKSEIDLDNEKGNNAFNMALEATYGLEKKNKYFNNLWDQFDNSNSITLNAYIPLWDGGARKYSIQAQELDVLSLDLKIAEELDNIQNDIQNSFVSMNEFYKRAINMHESIALAEEIVEPKITQYTSGNISLNDLIRTIQQVESTEDKFIDVYIDYRESLLKLMQYTYYDFENKTSLVDAFKGKYQ